jgi:hypothetical protein
MQWGGLCKSDEEEVQPSSCCYCIIPCPCPPGKDPRSPLVPHLLDGKPYWFTFNQLSHFLRILSHCWPVPLSLIRHNLACYWPCYSDRWSCVAWVVATACYVPSLLRGPLGGLSTSSSGTHAACAFGKEVINLIRRALLLRYRRALWT